MSRLIIKNLPNSITSENLKERFSSQGVVTDVQLKYTPDGKFRHFGFIGFKSTDEADRAVEYFNNTYINQSKISVQHCAELGAASKPKAWSKYAPDSTAYRKVHADKTEEVPKTQNKKKMKEEKRIEEMLKKHKDDPLFREFMEAHTNEDSVLKVIKDDKDSGVDEAASEENETDGEQETKTEDKNTSAFDAISDLEYMKLKKKSTDNTKDTVEVKKEKPDVKQPEEKSSEQKLLTVKVKNLPFKTKKRELKELFCPVKPVGIRLPRQTTGFAYVTFRSSKDLKKALNKHKSFLRGKQIGVKKYTEKGEDELQESSVINEKKKRWKEQEEALFGEENIAESGSIFVRNLSYTITEEELTQYFATFGPLTDVTMPVDRVSRKYKGFATVTFMMPEHAVAAYTKLDGTVFHGRMLHLLPAKTKPSPEQEENKSFKDKKRDKQKASAGQAHNWNTLFLGQNAVVDILADKYDVSKQEMLTGSDVAVRLALGETQIVSDTRQFMLESGVSLDAFNQAPKTRSKTVILVKNLPANTRASEMQEIFCKFGELGRVVLPPSGITAIVEFLEASEAKKAFMSLAYTRFKSTPLFLEWAPDDTFYSATEKDEKSSETKVGENKHDDSKQLEKEIDEEEIDIEPEPETTLYVKNLNFDTTEESVKKHFSRCGRVCSVTIARKKDPARPGQLLSMGYGFVQFYRQAHVAQALKLLQHSSLDGHQLELKRSNRTLQDDPAVSRKKNNVQKQTGTKILVRNIAFQASEKEVLQLFKTFGEIKSLRLPKKMVGTGSHRGFAFVEFHTKHDAKRAMQAMCQSTHFFGRRLVLEWAQQDEDVEQLRKRTAQNFRPESTHRSKKARADLEIENEDNDED